MIDNHEIKLLMAQEHQNPNDTLNNKLSFADKCSEKLTAFFGSWPFIGCLFIFLIVWVILNTVILHKPFDVYPFILLNLALSFLAALQNPIIQMGSNLDMLKNKLREDENYERNKKSEKMIEYLVQQVEEIKKNNISLQDQNRELINYIKSNNKDINI